MKSEAIEPRDGFWRVVLKPFRSPDPNVSPRSRVRGSRIGGARETVSPRNAVAGGRVEVVLSLKK